MKRFSICSVGGHPSEDRLSIDLNAQLGIVLTFAAASPFHRGRPLAEQVAMLKTAQYFRQLKVYFNNYGDCVGYVVWAMLSPQVSSELKAKARRLESIEWNEGSCPWIVDFLVRPGSLRYVIRDLQMSTFEGYPTVSYERIRGGRRLVKSWHPDGFE